MPASPTDFRSAQYFNSLRLITNHTQTSFRNSREQGHQYHSINFARSCDRIINTTGEIIPQLPHFVMQQNALSYSLHFLLLLSQIQPAENYLLPPVTNALSPVNDAPSPAFSTDVTTTNNPNRNDKASLVGWFNILPAAAAAAVPLNEKALIQYGDNSTVLLTNEQKINELLTSIKDFFIATGQLKEDEGDGFELKLRTLSAGFPVVISHFDKPASKVTRHRRVLATEQDPRTAEHIKNNCAFEEEVLNTEGENKGKLLIFQAQRAEGPFRVIYDNRPSGRPTPVERGIAEGLKISVGALTLGLMSYIGNMIAAAKRNTYYKNTGDAICAERNRRIMIAETSTSLDADGLQYRQRGKSGPIKPVELMNAVPVEQRAAYYTRNPRTRIRKEILFGLQSATDAKGAQVYLKPTEKEGEYVTYHPHAINPKALERRVIVDKETLTWRYADSLDNSLINTVVFEGKSHIKIHGDYYELNLNHKKQYEIVVQDKAGITKYLPVYMEPLSGSWHLTVHNNVPVFNKKHEKIITRLKAQINDDYSYFQMQANNKKHYGSGIVYRAEKSGDASHYSLGEYIEMRGEILPVRQKVTPAHGVRYELFDKTRSYPVEWDGGRWIFEQGTSPHASKEMKALVTKDMYVKNIDASKVSASDNYGLKWDDQGNSYLKVKNNYVRINKLNSNRFALHTPTSKIILRFRKNKFFLETPQERLENILTVGLNGEKRKRGVEILRNVDGYNLQSASELLSLYDFPQQGFYNEQSFALYIEQNLAIPPWAKRFKKEQPPIAINTAISNPVSVRSWRYPELEFDLYPGNLESKDAVGHIYADANNENYIIKKFSTESSSKPLYDAIAGAKFYNFYYGPGAAEIFYNKNNEYYVRMYKTPGVAIDNIPVASLPADVENKFVDMFEIMNEAGISADSLRAENIVWDARSQSFYPTGMVNNHAGTVAVAGPAKDKKGYWSNVFIELDKKKTPAKAKVLTAQPGKNVDQGTASGSAGKSSGHDIAKPGSASGANAIQPLSSLAAMQSKKEAVNSLLRSRTVNADSITKTLDELTASITENTQKLLQEKQIHRMGELLSEIEKAIKNSENLAEVAAFINKNIPEVLNPGYKIRQKWGDKYDFTTYKWNNDLYSIRTTKSGKESINLLFPEFGEIELKQQVLDATAYERGVAQLSPAEREGLRTWTALPFTGDDVYSDGSRPTGRNINYEMNQNLRNGIPLPAEQQEVYDDMMSALNRNVIPKQQGEYIRSAAYFKGVHNPWQAGDIKPGENVSNLRQFMSVSSDTSFAKSISMGIGAGSKAIVHYKIKSSAGPTGPTPLLPFALTLVGDEYEYLYKPDSLFKVVEYSVTEILPPLRLHPQSSSKTGHNRIAVLLEEVNTSQLKEPVAAFDLFSGNRGEIRPSGQQS